jgi:hypothetical protein
LPWRDWRLDGLWGSPTRYLPTSRARVAALLDEPGNTP